MMNERTWRWVIGVVIAAHGIGHLYFLIPALGLASWEQKMQSWLWSSIAGGSLVRPAAILVWSLSTGIWIASGIGVLIGQGWWRNAAIGRSVVSLLGIATFATGLPLNPTINPVIFDLVTLVALLWLKWPSVALVGS
jgi:hypothetical protein